MTEIKRLNYFTSQFLVEADFRDEQNYHVAMRRRHNLRLHGWGIVDGLEVKVKVAPGSNRQEVQVGRGLAIDNEGQEIFVEADTPVEFENNVPPGAATFYVTAKYDPIPSDEYTLAPGKYTRVTEKPKVAAVSAPPPNDGSVVLLAKVERNADGTIKTPDASARRYVGLRVSGVGEFRIPGGKGIRFEQNGISSIGSDLNLNAGTAGGIYLESDVTANRAATFKQGLTVTDAAATGAGIAMNSKDIRLRRPADGNHFLGFRSEFGGRNFDGPVLSGYGIDAALCGGLGTTLGGNKLALSWKGQDVTVHGAATLNNTLTVSGGKALQTTAGNNTLDIQSADRTTAPVQKPAITENYTHPTGLTLYVTANSEADSGGVQFRHSDGSQGIGFGYNTIYATGPVTDQRLRLRAHGDGILEVLSGALLKKKLTVEGDTELKHGLTVTGSLTTGGGIAMNSQDIRLATPEVTGDFLGYRPKFGDANVDGPVLSGHSGGALTTRDEAALSWARQDVTVHGKATIKKGLWVEGAATLRNGLEAESHSTIRTNLTGDLVAGPNTLDVQRGPRTNGALPPKADLALCVTGTENKDGAIVEFSEQNGARGIGFGYNTIYATGWWDLDKNLTLKPKTDGRLMLGGNTVVHGTLTVGATVKDDITITITRDAKIDRSLKFEDPFCEKISFRSPHHAIGVQNSTLYARSDHHFAWYKQGGHVDNTLWPGGSGIRLMSLTDAEVDVTSAKIGPGLTVEVDATFKKGLTVTDAAATGAGIAMNGKDIRLAEPADEHHFLGLRGEFGGRNFNGPVLSGYGAGAALCGGLGTTQGGNKLALSWKGQDVTVYGSLRVEGAASIVQESWIELAPWDTRSDFSKHFTHGWVNHTTQWNPAGYFKDSLGIVHLKGLVRREAGTNDQIFQLPDKYRPAKQCICPVASGDTLMTPCRVDVSADGWVRYVSGGKIAEWLCLDGITFRVA